MTFIKKLILATLVAWLWKSPASAHAQEIVTLPTRPGVTQSYFLARVPEKPRAIALLFPGGYGLFHLRKKNGQIKFDGENFLVKNRVEFVKRSVAAAIPDAPSDQSRSR